MTTVHSQGILTVRLVLPNGGEPAVREVVMQRRSMIHRLTPRLPSSLNAVLADGLVARIRSILTAIPDGTAHEICLASQTVVIPGLVLHGSRAIASSTKDDGTRMATASFTISSGTFRAAFRDEFGLDMPTVDAREALTVRALEDVVTPLLNIAATMRVTPDVLLAPAARPRLEAQLDTVARHAQELEYHAGLLRRYVDQCAPTDVSAPPVMASA